MLLAEDLLLLLTDDATGRLSVSGEPANAGLGGANLAELTLRGQVDVSGDQDPGRRGRIIVRDPSPPPGQRNIDRRNDANTAEFTLNRTATPGSPDQDPQRSPRCALV